MERMRGRVLAWVGGAVAVAAAVVLGVYFAVEGLGKADKVAGVAGTFIGLAGLVASVYGIFQARREASGSSASAVRGGQSVTDTRVAGGVTQVEGVTGSVRIGGAPTHSSAAPPAPAPAAPSSASGLTPSGVSAQVPEASGPGGGQSVTNSQVGGDVTQVDGVDGDVDIDR
jgi:hypothetical protein